MPGRKRSSDADTLLLWNGQIVPRTRSSLGILAAGEKRGRPPGRVRYKFVRVFRIAVENQIPCAAKEAIVRVGDVALRIAVAPVRHRVRDEAADSSRRPARATTKLAPYLSWLAPNGLPVREPRPARDLRYRCAAGRSRGLAALGSVNTVVEFADRRGDGIGAVLDLGTQPLADLRDALVEAREFGLNEVMQFREA